MAKLRHPLARFGCLIDDSDPEYIAVLAEMEAQRGQRLEHRQRRAAERTARAQVAALELRMVLEA